MSSINEYGTSNPYLAINPKNPIKNSSHLRVFYGNLAPRGAVGKITGKEGEYFKGKALVFESEDAFITDFEINHLFYDNIKQIFLRSSLHTIPKILFSEIFLLL